MSEIIVNTLHRQFENGKTTTAKPAVFTTHEGLTFAVISDVLSDRHAQSDRRLAVSSVDKAVHASLAYLIKNVKPDETEDPDIIKARLATSLYAAYPNLETFRSPPEGAKITAAAFWLSEQDELNVAFAGIGGQQIIARRRKPQNLINGIIKIEDEIVHPWYGMIGQTKNFPSDYISQGHAQLHQGRTVFTLSDGFHHYQDDLLAVLKNPSIPPEYQLLDASTRLIQQQERSGMIPTDQAAIAISLRR